MHASQSAKHSFLHRGAGEDDQEYFENLIRLPPTSYKPGPTGTRAHLSLSRTKIVRGGLGSGKTRWACEHIYNLGIQYPGSLHLIGRRDLTVLRDTTMKEFLEFVVRPETVHSFNSNENSLYLKNSSQFIFRDTKDKSKVKSLQLTSWMIDEADENEDDGIWSFLDDRLRQKFERPDGTFFYPPFCGLLVFNPTSEQHWLYHLSKRTDIDVEDFQFSTYENAHNLPPNYIPNLERKLSPWDRQRLLHGNWGREVKGKPVYHGFTEAEHVRPLKIREDLPLIRGWDFGFGHPAVTFMQIDHRVDRYYVYREFLGTDMYLKDVVPIMRQITQELVGPAPAIPVMDFGDPHGADEKDTSVSSIEYLRIHHRIFVQSQRTRIKTGMEQIQDRILARAKLSLIDPESPEAPCFLVDPAAKVTIDAFLGGYHRAEDGTPEKDGYFDHIPDTIRYVVVNNMNRILASKRKQKPYRPRNIITGY